MKNQYIELKKVIGAFSPRFLQCVNPHRSPIQEETTLDAAVERMVELIRGGKMLHRPAQVTSEQQFQGYQMTISEPAAPNAVVMPKKLFVLFVHTDLEDQSVVTDQAFIAQAVTAIVVAEALEQNAAEQEKAKAKAEEEAKKKAADASTAQPSTESSQGPGVVEEVDFSKAQPTPAV